MFVLITDVFQAPTTVTVTNSKFKQLYVEKKIGETEGERGREGRREEQRKGRRNKREREGGRKPTI